MGDLNIHSDSLYDKVDGFNLRVEDLIVWVSEKKKFGNITPKKAILKGIKATFSQGTMTAIVGPSGCGKTTLLNFLSGRQNTSQMFRTYCDFFLNGQRIKDISDFKNIVGYVVQEDILETRSTPREIFDNYTKLRGLDHPERKITEVLDAMNMKRCADTIVGDAFTRGLSGGEKKRTSIGIELISSPYLLLLDEPTTGLDSTTALDIIMTLSELKKTGITVICTVHQPSEEIMALFDKVLMLVDGHLVYNDSPYKIEEHLKSIGFQRPPVETAIEMFMKVVDKDDIMVDSVAKKAVYEDSKIEQIYQERIQMLLKSYQERETVGQDREDSTQKTDYDNLINLANSKNQLISFWLQFWYIFSFYLRLFFRHWRGLLLRTFMTLMIFGVVVVVFYNLRQPNTSPILEIQNKAGLISIICMNAFFSAVAATTNLILPTKQTFLKDRQSRIYSPFAYFLAVSTHVIPYYITQISIISMGYFFIFRLYFNDTDNLAWFWLFNFFSHLGGGSVGLVVAAIGETYQQLAIINSITMLPMFVVSGFYANVLTISWPLRIYSYLSPVRFSFQGLILNEFRNPQRFEDDCRLVEDCLFDKSIKCGYQVIPNSILFQNCNPFVRFNFEQKEVWLNFVILAVLAAGWRLIAFLIFVIKNREKKTAYSFDSELFEKYGRGKNKDPKNKIKEVEFLDKKGNENGKIIVSENLMTENI